MAVLSREQVDAFGRDGYLMVGDAVTPHSSRRSTPRSRRGSSRAVRMQRLRAADDRRPAALRHGRRTQCGKAGAAAHQQSSDISEAYREVMLDARTVDMVADLIGPDVKFHHCKINLKLSGARTEVAYHQDFAYTPHTTTTW